MTYNHFQIDSSGLPEAIEAAIPDPMARLGNHVELMFIHPANRELVARLLILQEICAAMASAVFDNAVEQLSPIPTSVRDRVRRQAERIDRDLTYAMAPPQSEALPAPAALAHRVHTIHRPPFPMTPSHLAQQISELISESWPDPAAAVAAERRTIADWLRRSGWASSITPAGIALPDFIAAGGHAAPVEAPPPPALPRIDAIRIPMVPIPAGKFLMGSPSDDPDRYDDEGPQHEVTLETFFLSRTPITQAQWRAVAALPMVERELNLDPSFFKGDNLPVEQVSWHDAMEFCARLSRHSGQVYTLPSEAQWEYACRAGTSTPFAFGETLTKEEANFNGDRTTPVGIYPSNAWGPQDMHGNVWEWCLDDWHDSYKGSPADGSAWVEGDGLGKSFAAARGTTSPGTAARLSAPGSTRATAITTLVSASVAPDSPKLLRGGSWSNLPRGCRSAYRLRNHPDCRGRGVGFRVCCLPQD